MVNYSFAVNPHGKDSIIIEFLYDGWPHAFILPKSEIKNIISELEKTINSLKEMKDERNTDES